MTNKIAIITGGSRGLGKNTALKLASQGVDVIITYRSQQAEADAVVVQAQALGVQAAAVQLDVAESKTFAEFAATIKDLLSKKWQRSSFDFTPL